MTISGLTSSQYLFFRATAGETNTVTDLTNTGGFTNTIGDQTASGGSAANQAIRGEFTIFTGTGTTSNPTYATADQASVFVAFKENAAGPVTDTTKQVIIRDTTVILRDTTVRIKN
jgi:hypothetical protein